MRGDIGNANTADKISSYAVEVYDGAAWKDLTALDTYNRVRSLRWGASRSNGRWSAKIEIVNTQNYRDDSKSLDPGHTSAYNPAGVPLLGAYHDIKITLAKGGAAGLVFQGFVGPGVADPSEELGGRDYFTVTAVGVMHPYFDHFIQRWEGQTYEETYIKAAENMLNTILGDYGHAQNVILASDPNKYMHCYEIGQTNIGEALQRPIHSIGYCLEERYYAVGTCFRPTVIDPDRGNAVPDLDLSSEIEAVRTRYTEANVRTWINWIFRNRVTGKEDRSVVAKDEAAKAIYGIPDGSGGRLHKKMWIVEKDQSTNDTRSEVMDSADMALHDTSTPCPEIEVPSKWLWLGIELGDLVRVTTPSETIDLGVYEISHVIASPEDMLGSTVISGTIGKRVGNRRYWFNRSRMDWVGKHDRDRDQIHGPPVNAPVDAAASGLWGDNEDGTPASTFHVSWHGMTDPRINRYQVRHKKLAESDTGTADGGTTTTLTDAAQSWGVGRWRRAYLVLGNARKGSDEVREIVSNTPTVLTFAPALTNAPAASEAYQIMESASDWEHETVERYSHMQVGGLAEGSYRLAQVAAIPQAID